MPSTFIRTRKMEVILNELYPQIHHGLIRRLYSQILTIKYGICPKSARIIFANNLDGHKQFIKLSQSFETDSLLEIITELLRLQNCYMGRETWFEKRV